MKQIKYILDVNRCIKERVKCMEYTLSDIIVVLSKE